MGVKATVNDIPARFDEQIAKWESESDDLRQVLQNATDARGYEALPWDPSGVEHVRQILADYGGEIVEVEEIDEADAVDGRIY